MRSPYSAAEHGRPSANLRAISPAYPSTVGTRLRQAVDLLHREHLIARDAQHVAEPLHLADACEVVLRRQLETRNAVRGARVRAGDRIGTAAEIAPDGRLAVVLDRGDRVLVESGDVEIVLAR